MKNVSKLLGAALFSALLASCASRTMDSVPTEQELEAYERVIKSRMQGEYDELARMRERGTISQADYEAYVARLKPIDIEAGPVTDLVSIEAAGPEEGCATGACPIR